MVSLKIHTYTHMPETGTRHTHKSITVGNNQISICKRRKILGKYIIFKSIKLLFPQLLVLCYQDDLVRCQHMTSKKMIFVLYVDQCTIHIRENEVAQDQLTAFIDYIDYCIRFNVTHVGHCSHFSCSSCLYSIHFLNFLKSSSLISL